MSKWAILLYGLGISGGANVIFEHALYAFNKGVEITFVTRTLQSAKDASWHKGTENFSYKTLDEVNDESFDVAIATEWRSAFDVYRVRADKYIYFVQSIESRFFANSSSMLAYLANNTYELEFSYITEAHWIRDYLQSEYGKNALIVRNGIDKRVFATDGTRYDRTNRKCRFLIEGSIHNWLKNVQMTVELCKKSGAEELWLVTPDEVDNYPGVDRVFSRISMENMGDIYRSCDVIIKLSLVEGMFGPPLEMFHCGGTAIVYDISGADEYIVDGYNALMIPQNDEEAVVRAVSMLNSDEELLRRLKTGAIETAKKWIDWEKSSSEFYDVVERFPLISSTQKKSLFRKAEAGASAYRTIERVFGAEPSYDRVSTAVKLLDNKKADLVLYGAGELCKSSIISFAQKGAGIKAIVVTDTSSNPKAVLGHKVYGLNEIDFDKDRTLIYITTEKYHDDIKDDLNSKGFIHII